MVHPNHFLAFDLADAAYGAYVRNSRTSLLLGLDGDVSICLEAGFINSRMGMGCPPRFSRTDLWHLSIIAI
jgi:hypothetical protein